MAKRDYETKYITKVSPFKWHDEAQNDATLEHSVNYEMMQSVKIEFSLHTLTKTNQSEASILGYVYFSTNNSAVHGSRVLLDTCIHV